MEESLNIIIKILFDAISTVCITGSIMMYIRGRQSRPEKIQANIFMYWGISYLLSAVLLHYIGVKTLEVHLDIFSVISSNINFIILMLFPLEVVSPRWLSMKRVLLLSLPIIVLSAIYFILLGVMGERVEEFTSFGDLIASISHFNVWFRFAFLLSLVSYIIFLLRRILRHEACYVKWMSDNFAHEEYLDMSWMRYYIRFVIIICVSWFALAFTGNTWCYLVHSMLMLVFFTFVSYKVLFQKSPYPEDFSLFCHKTMQTDTVIQNMPPDIQYTEVKPSDNIDYTFNSKLQVYVDSINNWMVNEKPYLYKDFKLTDVSRLLPLNRTYLSRVFNEGMGHSFSEVVRNYRVEYSKEILHAHPDYSLQMIAEASGFTSASTLIRAFIKVTGMSPTEYRKQK